MVLLSSVSAASLKSAKENQARLSNDAISAAESAVRANKLALSGTREEQNRGRRTVLDVLNAEQELLNSQVALTRAQHGKTAAYFAILASTGLLSPQNLGIKVKSE